MYTDDVIFFLVKRGENLLDFRDLHSHENYELTPERCPVSPCVGISNVYWLPSIKGNTHIKRREIFTVKEHRIDQGSPCLNWGTLLTSVHSSHTSVVRTNLNLITIMQSGVKYAIKSHTSTLMLDRRSFQTVASLNLSAPVNKRKRVA